MLAHPAAYLLFQPKGALEIWGRASLCISNSDFTFLLFLCLRVMEFHILAVCICWLSLVISTPISELAELIHGLSIFKKNNGVICLMVSYVVQISLIIHIFLHYLSRLQNARPPLPPTCPVAFRHLVNRCWSSNPDKRPHSDEIVSILESYLASLEEDPEFLSSFVPSPDHTTSRCLPNCIAWHRSAHSKPLSSS